MSAVVALLILMVAGLLLSALVIWVVGKLGLGLSVDGFGSAFAAAIVIAVVGFIINLILSLLGIEIGGGIIGGIIHLIIAAVVLLISDRFLKGMQVAGFIGALVAAVAIGVVY